MEPDLHKRHYYINQYKNKLSTSEDNLQRGVFTLQNIVKNFEIEISPQKI